MVNIIYQCSICKTTYSNRSDAEKCESRGALTPKFKLGSRVKTTYYDGRGEFEAEVIRVFSGHDNVSYNIRAFDRERFTRVGGFTRDEDELIRSE